MTKSFLERGALAKSAASVFFEERNSIDIFIEDTAPGYSKLFQELFKRVFLAEYKIEKVFPLGTRQNVIDECRKGTINNRPSLYIVDGDLYLLNNKDTTKLAGLFTLPRYCIENFLFDENAIAEVLDEEDHEKDSETLRREFNFQEWYKSNNELLMDLFKEYAVSNLIHPSMQTVGYKMTNLVASNKGVVDRVKVENRITLLREAAIKEVGRSEYDKAINIVEGNILSNEKCMLKYVSGKDGLMPLFMARFKSIVSTKAQNINIRIRLAMKCDISVLSKAKTAVLR